MFRGYWDRRGTAAVGETDRKRTAGADGQSGRLRQYADLPWSA